MGLVSKLLPRINIRQVNLHCRHARAADSITQGYACMSISASIQNNRITSSSRLVNPIYQLAFVIALTELYLNARLRRPFLDLPLNIAQRSFAINRWFANTKHVQVRPIQIKYPHGAGNSNNPEVARPQKSWPSFWRLPNA